MIQEERAERCSHLTPTSCCGCTKITATKQHVIHVGRSVRITVLSSPVGFDCGTAEHKHKLRILFGRSHHKLNCRLIQVNSVWSPEVIVVCVKNAVLIFKRCDLVFIVWSKKQLTSLTEDLTREKRVLNLFGCQSTWQRTDGPSAPSSELLAGSCPPGLSALQREARKWHWGIGPLLSWSQPSRAAAVLSLVLLQTCTFVHVLLQSNHLIW